MEACRGALRAAVSLIKSARLDFTLCVVPHCRDEFSGALIDEPMLYDCFVRTLRIPGLVRAHALLPTHLLMCGACGKILTFQPVVCWCAQNGEIKAEFRDIKRRNPKLRLSTLQLVMPHRGKGEHCCTRAAHTDLCDATVGATADVENGDPAHGEGSERRTG